MKTLMTVIMLIMVIRLWMPITFEGERYHTIWADEWNLNYPVVHIFPNKAKHPYLPKCLRINADNIQWATTLEELEEIQELKWNQ